ncbi:hypothetical protein NDU88_005106 [Pleurodeles waltl]|uniref:Uncharacterized protein n=1 Tax=Pleurodeles waltl TaxID=8319 RepID=A0AAV7UH36_PLEWA|nr:hypothetical protein NDU88_005106 [Pleurodeles waltl]
MLNNIPRPRKPDPTDASASPGPGRRREADAHPARSQTVRRSQQLCPARRYRGMPMRRAGTALRLRMDNWARSLSTRMEARPDCDPVTIVEGAAARNR